MIWNRQSVDWLAKHRTNGFASPEAFILHLLRAREECGKGFYRAPRRAKGRWFMDDSLVRKDANVNSQVASKCFRVYLWRTLHKISNNQQHMGKSMRIYQNTNHVQGKSYSYMSFGYVCIRNGGFVEIFNNSPFVLARRSRCVWGVHSWKVCWKIPSLATVEAMELNSFREVS